MSDGDQPTGGGGSVREGAPETEETEERMEYLYFFPDAEVTRAEVEKILAEGPEDKRAWVVSHLLRFAQWDDIWQFVSRDEVRRMFATLDLPDNLRQAYGRMLKIEAEVG